MEKSHSNKDKKSIFIFFKAITTLYMAFLDSLRSIL